jgi:hypothetical protein
MAVVSGAAVWTFLEPAHNRTCSASLDLLLSVVVATIRESGLGEQEARV